MNPQRNRGNSDGQAQARQQALQRPGQRRQRNTGREYPDAVAAERAARRYAGKHHPDAARYRGACSSGDHVHVDKFRGQRKIHTHHYYWSQE